MKSPPKSLRTTGNEAVGAAMVARLGFTVYLVVSHSSALIRSI